MGNVIHIGTPGVPNRTYQISEVEVDKYFLLTNNFSDVLNAAEARANLGINGIGQGLWGSVVGDIEDQADLMNKFAEFVSATNTNLFEKTTLSDIQLRLTGNESALAEGKISWNTDRGLPALGLGFSAFQMAIGEDRVTKVINKSGYDLLKGTLVRINGVNSGFISVAPAQADDENTSAVFGIVVSDIIDDVTGYVINAGRFDSIDTNSFSAGDIVYLSATVEGGITNVEPALPNISVPIGRVLVDSVTGSISLEFASASSGGGGGSMTYPSAGIAVSDGSAWSTSIVDNSANWNSAYGWGNHASAGYLTSQISHDDVLVDGDFTSTGLMKRGTAGVYSIVTDNSSNWNTAYGWGNHAGLYVLQSLINISKHYTGFPERDLSSIDFVPGTLGADRTITVSGTNFSVYIEGVAYIIPSSMSIQIPDVTGLYWVWFTAPGGVLQLNVSLTPPGFDKCLVCTVYWNTTVDDGLPGDERHWMGRDKWYHEMLHETVGARYGRGLALSPTDTTFSLSAGEIYDEDLEHSIPLSTTCRVMYKNGSADWEWDSGSTTLYKLNGTSMRYNNGNALADVPNNDFVAMWVYATNSPTNPIEVIIGQRVDGTIANARANNVPTSLSFGALPSAEMKLLYRVIFRQNVGSVTYQETADYRSVSSLPGSNYVATDHSALSNLAFATSGHTGFFGLDQTTPQSVTGGAPIFDALKFNIAATPLTNAEGLLQWNATDGTLDLGMSNGDITMQVGQELFIKVSNRTVALIPNGTPVYVSGRHGNLPTIGLCMSNVDSTSRVVGLTTQDIDTLSTGYVTTVGYVRQIKTDYSGSGDWGTTWAEGDKLYISKTVAGQLTNIEPSAPHHSDIVGCVGVVGALGIGSIMVNIDRHSTLEELSDIDGTALTATGQIPVWDNVNKYFDFNYNIGNYATKANPIFTGNITQSHASFDTVMSQFYTSASSYGWSVHSPLFNINVGTNSVGIGTTTPKLTGGDRAVLDVNGVSSSVIGLSTGGTNRVYLYATPTGCGLYHTPNALFTISTTGTLQFMTGATEKMRLSSSGYLGIGTNNPVVKLQVSNANAGFGWEVNPDIGGNVVGFTAYHRTTGAYGSMRHYAEDHALLGGSSTTGKVGIGTTTPGEILHLKFASPAIRFEKTGVLNWYAGNVTGNNFSIYPDSATNAVFNITSGGDIGIGTTTPSRQFNIKQTTTYNAPTLGTATGSFFIGGSDLYGLYAGVSGAGDAWMQVMRNDSAVAYNLLLQTAGGNLGIGTSTPQTKVHIDTAKDTIGLSITGNLTGGAGLNYTGISFNEYNATSSGPHSQIRHYSNLSLQWESYLGFFVTTAGSPTLSERFRVQSTGATTTGTHYATGDVIAYAT